MPLITKRPRQSRDAEPINAPAWKNLDFTRDGRSFLAQVLYTSEAEAKRSAEEWEASCARDHAHAKRLGLNGVEVVDEYGHHCFFWEEYSHTIQIPWLKP